jgi:hypothetical protein
MSENELQSLKQIYRLVRQMRLLVGGLNNQIIADAYSKLSSEVEKQLSLIVSGLWFREFDNELEREIEEEEATP